MLTGQPGVVVVGAGHAGFAAAAALRQAGENRPVTLVNGEPGLPYQRPPLSKAYLLGQVNRQAVAFRPDAFYQRKDIVLLSGRTVTGLDRVARRVHLSSGHALEYTQLVLATGALPRTLPVPGHGLRGICYLRRDVDADQLRSALAAARRPVVVGGGFIGLEFAAVSAARGTPVTVLEGAARLLGRSVSAATAEFLTQAHRGWGNQVLTGAQVARFTGDDTGQVTGVGLVGGQIVPADLVLVGVGAQPDSRLAESAGLPVDDGVLVDRCLRSADPAIFAVGDCARFACDGTASTLRRESVQNATDQARAVARTITGTPQAYTSLPWFWSDQHDIKLQIAGDAAGCDETVTTGNPAAPSFSTFCFRSGSLIAVESVNQATDHVAARRLLGQPAWDSRKLTSALLTPGFSLGDFVPGRRSTSSADSPVSPGPGARASSAV